MARWPEYIMGICANSNERTQSLLPSKESEFGMSVTYYVALPFVRTEDGVAAGQAQECPNETSAVRRAEGMSRLPENAGALAFKRSGDPN